MQHKWKAAVNCNFDRLQSGWYMNYFFSKFASGRNSTNSLIWLVPYEPTTLASFGASCLYSHERKNKNVIHRPRSVRIGRKCVRGLSSPRGRHSWKWSISPTHMYVIHRPGGPWREKLCPRSTASGGTEDRITHTCAGVIDHFHNWRRILLFLCVSVN